VVAVAPGPVDVTGIWVLPRPVLPPRPRCGHAVESGGAP